MRTKLMMTILWFSYQIRTLFQWLSKQWTIWTKDTAPGGRLIGSVKSLVKRSVTKAYQTFGKPIVQKLQNCLNLAKSNGAKMLQKLNLKSEQKQQSENGQTPNEF